MTNWIKQLQAKWLNTNMLNVLGVFIAVNVAALVIWGLDMSAFAMPMILGIIATALSEHSNRIKGWFNNLIIMLIAFGAVSFTVQIFIQYQWIFIPLMTMITFIVVMLGAVGGRYNKIAFCSLLVAVYTALAYIPEISWYVNPILILIGTLIYSVVSLVIYLCTPHRMTQEKLAIYFESLGDYLQQKSTFFDIDDDTLFSTKKLTLAKVNTTVIQHFDEAREVLFNRLDQQHYHLHTQKMLCYYFTGQEILERASSSHSEYQELFEQFEYTDLIFRLRRLLEFQALECRYIAKSLRENTAYHPSIKIEKILQGLQRSFKFHHNAKNKTSFYKLVSVFENIKKITHLFDSLSEEHMASNMHQKSSITQYLLSENISSVGNVLKTIKQQCHLKSELFRHAIRLSIVVFVCCTLVEVFQLPLGYWVLLTAILVCKPNYSATKKRLIQRVMGTVLGVVVGLGLRYLSPTLEAQLGIIVAMSSLFFFFMERKYGVATFCVTIQVLVSFDVIGLGKEIAIIPRVFDTLLGTGIAWFAVSFLWADWKYLNLKNNVEKTLQSSSLYLTHIMAQLQFGYRNHFGYRLARRMAYHNIANLSTTVSFMQEEPKKYKESLGFAAQLLELSYTLLNYISALGVYRQESETINAQLEHSSHFFKQGKNITQLLNFTFLEKQGDHRLSEIAHKLQHLEQDYLEDEKDQIRVLVQQLLLIVHLLPKFEEHLKRL